ncbi:MAG: glycine cleavage system protein H [bacterium]
MEGIGNIDIFATKGIEYLLVIGYLMILIFFWRFLNKPALASAGRAEVATRSAPRGWFSLADGFYFHQGHTWARPEANNTVKVGVDDFAQKLIGKPDSIMLPQVGGSIKQGEKGWQLRVDSKSIEMLSPVDGEVLAVNEEVLNAPEQILQDPYHKGWLMKIRVPKMKSNLRNLLSGKLAIACLEDSVNKLRQMMAGDLGLVLQDGGFPVSGFAKQISPDKWDEIAREFFLTE